MPFLSRAAIANLSNSDCLVSKTVPDFYLYLNILPKVLPVQQVLLIPVQELTKPYLFYEFLFPNEF